ncbi:succinate dehydrogenase [Metarhizium brunneum]
MPIFQDDLEPDRHRHPGRPSPLQREPTSSVLRRLSEESLPAELCEGPLPNDPTRPTTSRIDEEAAISCRAELIERLKRGESPTWIPNRHLESILQRRDSPTHIRTSPESPKLLPPVQITPEKVDPGTENAVQDRLQDGLNIERPRSALHSGDFTHDQAEQDRPSSILNRQRVESQLASESSWIATSPPRDFTPFNFERRIPFQSDAGSFRSVTASPLSASLSSSFAYHPPTSPLVQSESNDELDFSMAPRSLDVPSRELNRRLSALNSAGSSPFTSPSPLGGSRLSFGRRDGSLPWQAHQPRRSLTSTPTFALHGTPPQTSAVFRARRPSFGPDSSPIQHASMVGSYEESILRGRMSTTPSKPFDFTAQIGVLGKGRCKSCLRCPPHVSLPFAAVYYSYSNTAHGRSRSDDGPSPYVGQIDLENGLPNSEEESRSKRKAHGRYLDRQPINNQSVDTLMPDFELDHDRPGTSRPRRRTGSSKAPPGGSYRIPEKGQIQIIIKNQNKTAVKLFLVPYDLTGMEPGTKTFVRQRSYSAGPIIDHIPNLSETDAQSRPMLRYLVHLHICCPSKSRFYLYKSIRVVFANRVPEGKEKLRNETTWPEPRFTPYKPIRVMHPPLNMSSGPGSMLVADKAFRRRSLGITFGGASSRAFDMVDGFDSSGGGNTLPIEPIPFRLPSQGRGDSDTSNSASNPAAGPRSPESSQASRPSTKDSAGLGVWDASGDDTGSPYEKLSRGDFGYGGSPFLGFFGNGSPGGTEGLLSQRLRSLGVNRPQPPESAEDLA